MKLTIRQGTRAGKRIVGSWEAVAERKYRKGRYDQRDLSKGASGNENWLFLDDGPFRHIDAKGVQRKGRWLVQERLIVRTATKPNQSVAIVLDVPFTTSLLQVDRVRRRLRRVIEGLPGGHVVGLMDVSGDRLDWDGLEDDRSQVLRRIARWQPRPGADRLFDGLAAAAQFLLKTSVDGPKRILLVSDGEDGGSRMSVDGALDFLRRANVRLDTTPAGILTPTEEARMQRLADHAGGRFGPLEHVGPSTSTGPSKRFTIVRLTDVRKAGSLVPLPDIYLLTTFIDNGRQLVIHTAGAHPDWPAALRNGTVLEPGIYGK
jgi:hypothetical protein